MIDGMRKFAKSKWAAVILFFPLIIGLATFLPNSFDGGGALSGGTLSRIGGREITVADVERDTQNMIDQVRQQEGRNLTPKQAALEGRVGGVISDLEVRNILLAYGDKVGIAASEESLKPYLERNKLLTDEFGKLSMDAIRYQAQQRNQSPRQFEELVRDFLTQDYIKAAAGSALKVPEVLSQPWINYLGESRTISLAQVTPSTAPAPADPTEAELKAWYDSHRQTFLQPERRRISVLSYTPDDFLDRVELTDAQVRAAYDKKIKDYSTPETRVVVEYESPDRNAVQSFVDLAVQGIPLDQVLAKTPGVTRRESTVKPDDIADKNYREFLFSLQLDKIHGAPVQIKEGEPFKTMIVTRITPGVATPFEQIADKVRRDAAWNDAAGLFEKSSEPFRDAAGGQPLEDIAKQFGIPVITPAAVNPQGRTMVGDTAQILTRDPDALRQLFTLSEGDMTNVFEGDNVRAMYRLDEIIAPYTLAFTDVKDRVAFETRNERISAARIQAADSMVAAVKGGAAFDKAAAAARLAFVGAKTVVRAGASQLDSAVIDGAFALKEGEVGVVHDGDNTPWVARIDKIEPSKPEVQAMLRAQLGQQASQSLIRDIDEVFLRGLRAEVDYKSDEAAIQLYLKGLVGDGAPQ